MRLRLGWGCTGESTLDNVAPCPRLLALPEPAPNVAALLCMFPPEMFFQVEGRLFLVHLAGRVHQVVRTRAEKW